MESPVVVDKPPEYHGSERGFPFDEEEGSGAWSELAARHPDIAARLRTRPATWARKRRPSSQDAAEDFGESFGGFDRFPFDDIPPEFREHFPSHWNRRFGSREEAPQNTAQPQSPPTQQQTAATQTEQDPAPSEEPQQTHLPQYGLRNTVDLGQKSPADPSLVDADERNQRSMSAPPDSAQNQSFRMSGQGHEQPEQASNVRHIPIFVEGRDEPVISRDRADRLDGKPAQHAPPPQPQPHIDREQYFADDGPVGFHHPPNFSRAFGTPFNKGYRQGPQPFQQQKVYPQTFARGASPQRSQSPKPAHHESHFVNVPVHHEPSAPRPEPAAQRQQRPAPQQTKPAPPKQPSPQREQTPPPQPKPQPTPNDPITQILSIQTDVLNLMTEVENFTGNKGDKQYLFLDEMLTRNLIKLDNIETDGKENIRLARKEAIKCIQKCIAVLEAKAESNTAAAKAQSEAKDVEMKENNADVQPAAETVTNGEVDMNEVAKDEEKEKVEPPAQAEGQPAPTPQSQEPTVEKVEEEKLEAKAQEEKNGVVPTETKELTPAPAADTRPNENAPEPTENVEQKESDTPSSKKNTKVVKKRNKSKDNKDAPKVSDKQENESNSNKEQKTEEGTDKIENAEVMQVDKVEKTQVMEVDGAASQ